MKTINAETTMNDLVNNPRDYGLPTFEEFVKYKEKFIGREDDKFILLDRGSQTMRELVKKYIYDFNGHKTSKLEHLEQMVRDAGLKLNELEWKPEVQGVDEGKVRIMIRVTPKVKQHESTSNILSPTD